MNRTTLGLVLIGAGLFLIALAVFLLNANERNKLYQKCLDTNIEIAKIYKDTRDPYLRPVDCNRW